MNNESDIEKTEKLLEANNIILKDKRIKPVSLENVFIHVLKDSNQKSVNN